MAGFSANLGFLWTDRPLPAAIEAAARAGFDAVECHFPFETLPKEVRRALEATGLPLLALNTRPGDRSARDFGLAAVPGREAEARAAIDEALDYAHAVGARAVHVMAGRARGPDAGATFLENLAHAAEAARQAGIGILIEPINDLDVPGYFLTTVPQAMEILGTVDAPEIRLMFDGYHVARMGSDPGTLLLDVLPRVGHIQFARVPDRGPPLGGAVDWADVFARAITGGWTGSFGAEYLPGAPTDETLGWMEAIRRRLGPDDAPQAPPS